MLTFRDIAAIRAVAHYHVLSRAQLQKLCYPTDRTGRATRKRLDMLVAWHLLNRTPTPIFNRRGGSPWPAYYPSPKGCDLLAHYFEDENYLLAPTCAPPAQNLLHSIELSDVHMIFDAALAHQDVVTVQRWINEYDVVNLDEVQPGNRIKLFTLLREYPPRLVCSPDAAFLLSVHEHRKIHYVEVDRETSGVRSVASKAFGYAELFNRRLHQRHFPEANVERVSVLLVTLSAKRRHALVRAFRDKPRADLWRFASRDELSPESCMFSEVFHKCEGEPTALIRGEVKAEFDAARAVTLRNQSSVQEEKVQSCEPQTENSTHGGPA